VATLELTWRSPERGYRRMNLILGSWVLQDLRKSYNRLPDEGLLSCMQTFAKQYDIWAKRPGSIHLASQLGQPVFDSGELFGRDLHGRRFHADSSQTVD
jgi:hypothetical protein